jgi:hypothetical protein
MVWIFHALRGYSALLQGYAVGSHSDLDLGYILELRNYVHYHILSIPAGMSVGMESVSHIYEPFRLALTIYSLLVLFPIPLATSPYFNLTQILHRELEVVPKEEWSSMPTLLLWVLTLGGIAALDTPHRPWFVTRLHVQLEELGIISWKGFVHTMGTWIWLGSPCGTEGLILWKEAQEYGSH